MATSLHDICTVPELGDWGLGNIDNFEDIDINMESMEMINDSNDDPFGDFTLEQSFNLIELNNLRDVFTPADSVPGDSDPSFLLQDLDMRETLKQDCMWSTGVNTSSGVNINSNKTTCYSKLSLTPPTSYINQSLHILETPIPSDDESSGSETSSESYRSYNTGHSSATDHCYTSFSLLTPPESSEDEDCLVSASSLHATSKQRKNVLSQIENDRFNKDVKKSLLKSSQKNLKNYVKPKFKFSIRMKKFGRREPPMGAKLKQAKRSHMTTSSFTSNKQTDQVDIIDGIQKDKLTHTDARNVHNMMERQRRTDLKRAFDKLKDYVPSIAQSDRTSKQMVLDKAIEHCHTLRRTEETGREQKRNLLRRNELLRKKLALLQSQLTASQVENADWEIQGW